MIKKKIDEILEAHRRYLLGEPGGIRANLSGADLRGANLSSAYLRGANLSDANLSDANLSDANLRGADLRGANLSDANLRGADLRGADLRGADLRGADLRGANLSDANLGGANLGGANLGGADLSGANLGGANLHAPVVKNLHRAMVEAIGADAHGLDMGSWHTCATTHCRAGWAITLAGAAGRALEVAVGSAAAGALITMASCPYLDRVPNFYAGNVEALADIQACAAMEEQAS